MPVESMPLVANDIGMGPVSKGDGGAWLSTSRSSNGSSRRELPQTAERFEREMGLRIEGFSVLESSRIVPCTQFSLEEPFYCVFPQIVNVLGDLLRRCAGSRKTPKSF